MSDLVDKLPWSLRFVVEWLPYMTLSSVLRFRQHEIQSERGQVKPGLITLDLKRPIKGKVSLREEGSDVLTFYEVVKQEVYRDVVRCMPQCRTVIDIGANIGLASLYFANSFPDCKVMAVEPNPPTYAVLDTNMSTLVTSGRCKLANLAVWSHEAKLAADESVDPSHYSAFATKETSNAGDNGGIAGVTMETLLSQSGFSEVDLLKVDIEGAEVELFKGTLDWLKKINSIAIEFHGDSREVSRFDEIMARYGFQIVDEGTHTVVAVRSNA